MQHELRAVTTEWEIRSSDGKNTVEGYAALFGVSTEIGGMFRETIDRKAFNKTLKEADVRAVLNHDPNLVLGRSSAGTLRLSTDTRGLFYRVDMPNTTYANDLIESMRRGDIAESSFAFRTIVDEWDQTDQQMPTRTLKEVHLVDVSPVTYPAYDKTTSGLARSLEGLAKRSGIAVTDLSDTEAIRRAIAGNNSDVTPSPTPVTEEPHTPPTGTPEDYYALLRAINERKLDRRYLV
jgi:HK97 family phage prohead protease